MAIRLARAVHVVTVALAAVGCRLPTAGKPGPGETHGSVHLNPLYTETLVKFIDAHDR